MQRILQKSARRPLRILRQQDDLPRIYAEPERMGFVVRGVPAAGATERSGGAMTGAESSDRGRLPKGPAEGGPGTGALIIIDNSTLTAMATCPTQAALRYVLGLTMDEDRGPLRAG